MGQKLSNIHWLVEKPMTICESYLTRTYLEISGASSCRCIGEGAFNPKWRAWKVNVSQAYAEGPKGAVSEDFSIRIVTLLLMCRLAVLKYNLCSFGSKWLRVEMTCRTLT